MAFVKRIDLAISYSETAASDARRVLRMLPSTFCSYDYKDWLDAQAGLRISAFSKEIYSKVPCIVLATRDWFVRPATRLEMQFLSINDCPKLVFDYSGLFKELQRDHRIRNHVYGEYDAEEAISRKSVEAFIESLKLDSSWAFDDIA